MARNKNGQSVRDFRYLEIFVDFLINELRKKKKTSLLDFLLELIKSIE